LIGIVKLWPLTYGDADHSSGPFSFPVRFI